jgi:hypothetical protein
MNIGMPNWPSSKIDSKPTNGPDNDSPDDEARFHNHQRLLLLAKFIVCNQAASKHKAVHL